MIPTEKCNLLEELVQKLQRREVRLNRQEFLHKVRDIAGDDAPALRQALKQLALERRGGDGALGGPSNGGGLTLAGLDAGPGGDAMGLGPPAAAGDVLTGGLAGDGTSGATDLASGAMGGATGEAMVKPEGGAADGGAGDLLPSDGGGAAAGGGGAEAPTGCLLYTSPSPRDS